MAQRAIVQVDGMRQLRRNVKAAAADLPGGTGTTNAWINDIKDAYRNVGNIVAPAAKTKAPKRTGRLAGSVRTSGTTTAATVRVGYASVPYAGPIHYGWPARNIEPQPFVIDAGRATESRWVAAFQAGIDKLLSRIKGA